MNGKLEKELNTFKELSSDADYKLINEEAITFQDFRRLDYIIGTLGLSSLEIYFFNKHSNKFERQLNQLDKLDEEYDVYIDTDTFENWLKSFAKNIRNNSKRSYVEKLFKI